MAFFKLDVINNKMEWYNKRNVASFPQLAYTWYSIVSKTNQSGFLAYIPVLSEEMFLENILFCVWAVFVLLFRIESVPLFDLSIL